MTTGIDSVNATTVAAAATKPGRASLKGWFRDALRTAVSNSAARQSGSSTANPDSGATTDLSSNATAASDGPLSGSGQLRQVAAQFVAELFFIPLLAEMHKLPFGQKFGSGGRGEEVFSQQLDQQLADAVAGTQKDGLTSKITNWLERVSRPEERHAS